jgi:hypothetical protein
MGVVGGSGAWINSGWDGSVPIGTVAHELGHNFGAWHASSFTCTDPALQIVPLSSTCTRSEYGDTSSVMGSGLYYAHDAPDAWLYGWIPGQTIDSAGTYQLVRRHTAGTGPQLLRVRRNSTQVFDLELRAVYAPYDNFPPTVDYVNGVTIRLDNTDMSTNTGLLNAMPSTSLTLQASHSFVDYLTGTKIAVNSISTTSASITVSYLPVDTTPPSAISALHVSSSSVSTMKFAWTAAKDASAVRYAIARDGVVIGSAATASFADLDALPGQAHTWTVTPYDASYNVGPAQTITATVPADTQPPTRPKLVAIVTGLNVALTISASTDNDEIAGYDVYRSGVKVATISTTTVVDTAPPGIWSYDVVAFDRSGNRSAASAAVLVQTTLMVT